MAIVSFWSSGKGESGKTSSVVAITTLLSIQHNYKILVLDTKYNDSSYEDCYWQEDKTINTINTSNQRTNIASGISGLSKAILSNKTSPEIITNYTRIVFRDRLELLLDKNVTPEEYKIHKRVFKDIAKIASKYYDLVFIDIDNNLDQSTVNSLLDVSDVIVTNLQQKIGNLNDYLETKEKNPIFKEKMLIPLLGRYDKNSKYTAKNVARYIKERRGVYVVPYNTLFFEATGEGKVDDLFIKLRRINPKDKNAIFISEVRKTAEEIISRLRELQMRA